MGGRASVQAHPHRSRRHDGAPTQGGERSSFSTRRSPISRRGGNSAKPLPRTSGIQWMLADMAADLHAARLVCYDAAWRCDREPSERARVAAMANKLVASEMVFRVANRTLQLLGGAGYRKDEPVERIWR